MLDEVIAKLLEWYLSHLNYWVVTILMILENSIVPLPAELIVAPAAYQSVNGDMNIFMLIIFTTLGSVIGALINYYLSRRMGRYLIYRLADSKAGRVLMLSRDKLDKAERLFLKHGNISTFFGRLLPFGRQLISIPAGLARMPIGAFLIYTTIGSAIWNSLLVGAGYYLAQILSKDKLVATIQQYSIEASLVFLIMFIVYICINRMIHRK